MLLSLLLFRLSHRFCLSPLAATKAGDVCPVLVSCRYSLPPVVLAIHAVLEESIQCPAAMVQNSLTGPSPANPGPLQLPFFAHCLRDPPWMLVSPQARGAVHLGA